MRSLSLALAVLALGSPPLVAQTQTKPVPTVRPSHPEEVALVDEGDRGSVYRRFPGGQRLYTYDRDLPGRSLCNADCEGGWPPVPAPADAAPVGRWTIVVRHDGSRQWALDRMPVYTRFHDSPEYPGGDGFHGVWRLVPYMKPVPAPVP